MLVAFVREYKKLLIGLRQKSIMAFVDEREIDEWFEAEKERLSEKMMAELEKGVAFETAQQRFDKAFKPLLLKYDKEYRGLDNRTERHEKLAKPFRLLAAWWHERKHRFRQWRKERAEQKKKAKFEREYKKLFEKKKV